MLRYDEASGSARRGHLVEQLDQARATAACVPADALADDHGDGSRLPCAPPGDRLNGVRHVMRLASRSSLGHASKR